MSINPKKQKAVESHLNWMGGTSFDIKNPILRLRIAAASCFFGEPIYYHESDDEPKAKRYNRASDNATLNSEKLDYLRNTLNAIDPVDWRSLSPVNLMIKAIDAALDHSIEDTLREAVRLRDEDHIRTTPQIIMVRAACHPKCKGTNLVRRYAKHIMLRLDEVCVQLAYFISAYCDASKVKKIPNSLRKSWKTRLESASEYELAKYTMNSRMVKLVDVINICHPKNAAIDALMKGKISNNNRTWEAIVSKDGSNSDSWRNAVEVMGHMALLRNLRNLHQHQVDPSTYLSKLKGGVKDGKQLPFRYYSAYRELKEAGVSARILDAVEECLINSIDNLPQFGGKIMSLCDNSGSAQSARTSKMGTMQVSTIGNLTGIITGRLADDGYGVFGDNLSVHQVRKTRSIFDQLEDCDRLGKEVGAGTENGIWLFFDKAIRNKEVWDHIFVYSDMQAGHGGLYGLDYRKYSNYTWFGSNNIDVAKLIRKYRSEVNKNVYVYLVQIAGYQDTLVPEFYDRTYILGGWSDGIIRFAHKMMLNNQELHAQPKQ